MGCLKTVSFLLESVCLPLCLKMGRSLDKGDLPRKVC